MVVDSGDAFTVGWRIEGGGEVALVKADKDLLDGDGEGDVRGGAEVRVADVNSVGVGVDDAEVVGVSNSAGRTFGCAWTSHISLARFSKAS